MSAPAEQQARVAARRERVLRLRVAGMEPAQIAEQIRTEENDARRRARRRADFRYTRHDAVMDVKRALEDNRADMVELAGLHITLEIGRLESYTRTAESLMRQAITAGDRWGALRAMDRLVALGVRKDNLLGLSAVTRAAQDGAADESPSGEVTEADGLDEVGRKRAERRAGYGG